MQRELAEELMEAPLGLGSGFNEINVVARMIEDPAERSQFLQK